MRVLQQERLRAEEEEQLRRYPGWVYDHSIFTCQEEQNDSGPVEEEEKEMILSSPRHADHPGNVPPPVVPVPGIRTRKVAIVDERKEKILPSHVRRIQRDILANKPSVKVDCWSCLSLSPSL